MVPSPQFYAENLANQAFEALISEGAKDAPFIFRCRDDEAVIVLPVVSPDKESVQLWVFYGPKACLTADKLMNADPKELVTFWRKYCRAFVHARMSPRSDRYVVLIDHAGTRRAIGSLNKPYNVAMPPFEDRVDNALGTKLKDAHNKRWRFIDKYGEPLPALPPA